MLAAEQDDHHSAGVFGLARECTGDAAQIAKLAQSITRWQRRYGRQSRDPLNAWYGAGNGPPPEASALMVAAEMAQGQLSDVRTHAIRVNGESVDTQARSLAELMESLGFGGQRVATAVNGDFVPERLRTATPIRTGDRIEIVAPRQGG